MIAKKTCSQEDELVKHMSNLPTYLQNGLNFQDKPLNVGVLDWGRLQKWQCSNHKHKPNTNRATRYSFSTNNNTSSSFSTHGSSINTCSPSHQFHIMSSSTPAVQNFHQINISLNCSLSVSDQGMFSRADYSFSRNRPQIKTATKESETKIHRGKKTLDQSEQLKSLTVDQNLTENLLPPLPCDFPKKVTTLGHKKEEACTRKFSDAPNLAYQADRTDIKNSRLQSSEVGHSTMNSQIKYMDTDGKRRNSIRSSSVPVLRSEKIETSPPKVRNLEDEHSNGGFIKSSLKPSKLNDENVRSTSPFRRLTTGIGKIIKNSSSIGVVEAHQSCCDVSRNDKVNTTVKGRSSSPLRRLLDPVLKPKVANFYNSENPIPRENKACKPSNGRLDSISGIITSGKLKLDMSGCRIININDSAQEKKHESSTTQQALLQIAMRNGLPLFTFAVENNNDVLAATIKKPSTSKNGSQFCVYTFFRIQEVKKKNGRWMTAGCISKGQEVIPNVVAQMKASCSHKHVDQAREFVLFSVKFKQSDEPNSNIEANNELAAIVVKIPAVQVNQVETEHKIENGNKFLKAKDSFDPLNATVVLPSGAHSLPNKGGPSSLIERWRSGGSCDCGGWDLGCNLTILGNDCQIHEKSNSSESFSNTDQFELFNQGDVDEKQQQHVFSLSPFKDGIYTVEFKSSVSLLQAFSICIAVIESRKPWELFDSSNISEGKTSAEPQNKGRRDPSSNRAEGDIPPARYVSCPPHSPIGRV
ncbi:hypothetical protein ACFE04_013019 [Oxalis oulophora]